MRRTNLEAWICEVESIDCLTREGLETLQLRRLNELLTRERARDGFYRNLPEHVDSLDALRQVPFTTPEMLSEHAGGMLLTSQSEVARIISGATSGTTGIAKRVFYTEQDTEHTVGFFAAGISEMVRPGERVMIAMPFSGPFGLGDLIAKAVERLGAKTVRAGIGKTFGELCALVREAAPQFYIGFPVPLLGLARFYGADFPIRRALISGDACPKGVVEALEALLDSRLYPHYGSREMGLGGAVTCQAFEGMHLRENHVIAEIVDENGAPVPDGTWGELVITTIGLEAMPLVRYRTGDITRFFPGPCSCGGVTRRIDNVSRAAEGPVDMEALDSALFALPELIDYRAAVGGTLEIEALTLGGGGGAEILAAAAAKYPGLPVRVMVVRDCLPSDAGFYPGKRSVL